MDGLEPRERKESQVNVKHRSADLLLGQVSARRTLFSSGVFSGVFALALKRVKTGTVGCVNKNLYQLVSAEVVHSLILILRLILQL